MRDREAAVVGQILALGIGVAHERPDQVEHGRAIGRANTQQPLPFLVGQRREILHRLHVAPARQRPSGERDADVLAAAAPARERRLTIAGKVARRAYRMRDGRFEQVSLDHSLVEEQVRMGRMSHSEALRSPLRNVITRALGTQNSVTPDCFELEAEPGDVFMLCSDGLTRELSDEDIAAILKCNLALEDRCARLIAAAKRAGACPCPTGSLSAWCD